MGGWPHLDPALPRGPQRDLGDYARAVGSSPRLTTALTGACLGLVAGAAVGAAAGLVLPAAAPYAAHCAAVGACALGAKGWQEGDKCERWLTEGSAGPRGLSTEFYEEH